MSFRLLKQMGWNENTPQESYEITDQDREDYEKRRKLLPKVSDHFPGASDFFDQR